MGKKNKKKNKQAKDNGQAGGAGGATAMQVEAVVVGGHCAEFFPSLILRVGPECQLLFHAGAGLQRYWCVLFRGEASPGIDEYNVASYPVHKKTTQS